MCYGDTPQQNDTNESVVMQILEQNFNTENKLWLVQYGENPPSSTWKNHAKLKDLEAFHQYCVTHLG